MKESSAQTQEEDTQEVADDVAIRVTDVWKRFRTGVFKGNTLVREVQSFVARIQGKEDPNEKIALNRSELHRSSVKSNEWFWAVKGVNFEIRKGEVLAILGRNGAGKSTLLQLICGLTESDRGEIAVQGRFATLLQAGVGFHPELTGRENVFLNGSIMGLTRDEIAERIDEIAEFSEIPQFLDTPVKRYSSGMQGRLGFSVAAHLDADVMILDEVFATGDLIFRDKCIEKMQNLAMDGRTVVIVTHFPSMLGEACSRALFMEDGEIKFDGDRVEAVDIYTGVPAKQVENSTGEELDEKASEAERQELEAKRQAERQELEAKRQAERQELEAKRQAERQELVAKRKAERREAILREIDGKKRFLTKHPLDAEAHLELGRLYNEGQQLLLAYAQYRTAQALDPENVIVPINRFQPLFEPYRLGWPGSVSYKRSVAAVIKQLVESGVKGLIVDFSQNAQLGLFLDDCPWLYFHPRQTA